MKEATLIRKKSLQIELSMNFSIMTDRELEHEIIS